jgi:magnesium chelatase family protein
MRISKVSSIAPWGVKGRLVTVEVRIASSNRQPRFSIIGLGDGAVRESRDRVAEALHSVGVRLPHEVLVNLAPAEIKKEGACYDLPIAVGILTALNKIPESLLLDTVFFGELSLSGEIKPHRRCLSLVLATKGLGFTNLILPSGNVNEACMVPDLLLHGVDSLTHLLLWLQGKVSSASVPDYQSLRISCQGALSLDDVCGQDQAKRALQISAAGGHNLLMIGPPGCGKSMLAQRLGALLPPLSSHEALEVSMLHSMVNDSSSHLHSDYNPFLSRTRPFRAPHYSVTDAGLLGSGGLGKFYPGEVSLAHHGILFLDELPEFKRSALEGLRIPLESRGVTIARAGGSIEFPAHCTVIAAMNPCPCGRPVQSHEQETPHQESRGQCRCTAVMKERYRQKLSQPLLERIDLHVSLHAVSVSNFHRSPETQTLGDSTLLIAATVKSARERQLVRSGSLNSCLTSNDLKNHLHISTDARALLTKAESRFSLSARTTIRILKVARTIADLINEKEIHASHLAEALQFRPLIPVH